MKTRLIRAASIGITTVLGAFLSIRYVENEMERCFNERKSTNYK